MKRKLLIATDAFLPRWDGIGRFLLEIIPKLNEEYEITILAPNFTNGHTPDFNANIVRFDLVKIPLGDTFFTNCWPSMVKKYVNDSDLVFVQSLGPIGLSTIKSAYKKKPIIAYAHLIEWEVARKSLKRFTNFAVFLAKSFTKRFYNKCDLLICPSDEVMHKYENNKVICQKEVINLGTDTNEFVPAIDKRSAKEKLGIDPDTIIIGNHGRIAREKNLKTLYRAFRRLEKKYPKLKLMIVGKGLADQEKLFSSERNIILPGMQSDVVPYLQAMDIYATTSLTETTSLSTMEAMSCTLPTVMTPVGFIKDFIEEKENGMIFPFKNSLRLSMKIEQLINNKEERDRIGKNARITIQKHFSWDNTADKIVETLKRF